LGKIVYMVVLFLSLPGLAAMTGNLMDLAIHH
jgi:hypothetical protein